MSIRPEGTYRLTVGGRLVRAVRLATVEEDNRPEDKRTWLVEYLEDSTINSKTFSAVSRAGWYGWAVPSIMEHVEVAS